MFVLQKSRFIFLLCLFSAMARAEALPSDEISAAPKDKLNFLFVEYKPLMYRENGEIKGEIGALSMAVFERAGYEVTMLDDVPFRRVFHIFATGEERTCGAGWYKTPDRERKARFTDAINMAADTIVVTRKDRRALIESFPDIQSLIDEPDLKTARVNGVSGGKLYSSLLDSAKSHTIMVQRLEQQVRLLLAERIDYFLAEASYIAHVDGDMPGVQDIVAVDIPGLPKGENRYIACSKSTSKYDIERLNAAIKSFQTTDSVQ
jgi:hypothetical protein